MKQQRVVYITIIAAAVVLLAMTPLIVRANAHIFQANLTTDAELHKVDGSNANGHAKFTVTGDGEIEFFLKASRLSGPSWGAHIHGPATASQTGGILVSLCGAPAPAAVTQCATDAKGKLRVEGVITSDLLDIWGITAEQLVDLMEDGLTYVNVHTDLNGAGELRGQIR